MNNIKNQNEKPKNISSKINEKNLWSYSSFVILFLLLLKIITHGSLFVLLDNLGSLLLSISLYIFPTLFKSIFGCLPLEALQTKVNNTNNNQMNNIIKKHSDIKKNNDLYFYYIKDSQYLSENIYSRSGTYLLVGCLIAIGGIVIFYVSFLSALSSNTDNTISSKLISYLPRFGSLFFLEFIAFFFLKQHRIMMEEFRYYEKIKRIREDNYYIMQIIEKYKDDKEILEIIFNNCIFEQSSDKISKDETTQILEAQKLCNNDSAIFYKILDLISAVKNN